MPFMEIAAGGLAPQADVPVQGPGPSFWGETVPAALDLGNSLVSASNAAGEAYRDFAAQTHIPGGATVDPSYDPFGNISGYEEYASRFVEADTPQDVANIKRRIDKELAAKGILDRAGVAGFAASLGAGILDPINLIPIGGTAAKAATLGRTALESAVVTARAGAVSSLAQSAALYATQETMTPQDMVFDVAAGTLLGGVLGGAAPYAKAGWDAIASKMVEFTPASTGWSYDVGDFKTGQTRPGTDLMPYVRSHIVGKEKGVIIESPAFHIGEMPKNWLSSLASVNPDFVTVPPDLFVYGRALKHIEERRPGLLEQIGGLDGILQRTGEVLPNPTADDAWARPWLVIELDKASAIVVETRVNGRGIDIVNVIAPVERSRLNKARRRLADLGLNVDDFKVSGPEGRTPPSSSSTSSTDDASRGLRLSDGRPGDTSIGDLNAPEQGGSVGAAAVDDVGLKGETLKGALGAEKLPGVRHQDPLIRTIHSPSLAVRKITQRLAENPLMMAKNAEGAASAVAVETRIKMWQGALAQALPTVDDLFVRHRTGADRSTGDIVRLGLQDITGRNGGKLTRKEFMESVGRALRRGDSHPVPEVAEAAAVLRRDVFDPAKNEAISLGLLPEDVSVETAASYLMRVYNHEKIIARRGEFRRIISDYLQQEQTTKAALRERVSELLDQHKALTDEIADHHKTGTGSDDAIKTLEQRLDMVRRDLEDVVSKWRGKSADGAKSALKRRAAKEEIRDAGKPRLKEADKAVLDAAGKMVNAETSLERQELEDLADEIIDRILGTPAGRLPYNVQAGGDRGAAMMGPNAVGARGPLKARSFNIPDQMIEDFLESDAEVVARTYTRTMSADIELTRQFGSIDMVEQMDDIRREYAQMIDRAASEEERTRLAASRDADMRDILAMRDRMLGTFALPSNPEGLTVRTFRVVRNINYFRLLGGMTVSAIPDIARAVMIHGFSRTFGDGLRPLMKNAKGFRLAADEVKLAGTALDMVLDTRAMAIADVMDDYGRHSRFERGVQAMTSKFGLVSLMAPWNAAMKQFVGVITQSRMLAAIEALGKGSAHPAEVERLAFLGIDADMADRIARQVAAHGEKQDGGVMWANTGAWTDRAAVTAYRAAIVKEVDRAIVTPGQDKPLWMSTEIGKLIGQFKTFGFASTQRVALAALQQRDMAVLNGTILSVGLGMLSYALHGAFAGKERAEDPETWVKEGLYRSGVLFWMTDVMDMGGKVLGLNGSSRYASRSVSEALLGPTLGTGLDSVINLGRSAATGEWKAADTAALRRLIPFQNLFYLRRLFDAAEEGVNEGLGVPAQ